MPRIVQAQTVDAGPAGDLAVADGHAVDLDHIAGPAGILGLAGEERKSALVLARPFERIGGTAPAGVLVAVLGLVALVGRRCPLDLETSEIFEADLDRACGRGGGEQEAERERGQG